MSEQQRVMLWNPWQAHIDFYHGKPVDVPAGWRVLGMADKDIILVSVDDSQPVPTQGDSSAVYPWDISDGGTATFTTKP